jgi:choline-sulfatase
VSEYPDPIDGRSLLPLLDGTDDDRVAVSELLSEGVAAPYVMLRKGRYKFNFVEHDPPQLFDMEAESRRARRSRRKPPTCVAGG